MAVYNPFNGEENGWVRTIPAWNRSGAAIPHGAVVARHLEVNPDFEASPHTAETDNYVEAIMNTNSIIAPTNEYNRVIGIAQSRGGKNTSIADARDGRVVCAGLAQARVLVPSSVTMPIGCDLVFVAGQNYLKPVIYDEVATDCHAAANPVARLVDPGASAGAGTVQLLWVEVLPWHRPIVQQICLPFTVAHTNRPIACAMGPGMVLRAGVSVGTGGASSGSTSAVVTITPTASGAQTSRTSFSTVPGIGYGVTESFTLTGSGWDGDTDDVQTDPVRSTTLANSCFDTGDLLGITTTIPGGTPLYMTAHVELMYW